VNALSILVQDLESYARHWNADTQPEYRRYVSFVESTRECCARTNLAGHCTGSAFVVSPDAERVLLLFHPFLKRWLQPGGHADGNPDLLEVARREAHEETGIALEALELQPLDGMKRIPFDLDIHPIPARKQEPAHFHYDLRYLLVADPSLPITPESADMKVEWIPLQEVMNRTDEESVLRMVRKVRAL
jgi:8-oxo-dGTP pyrophosphatase MutT (NUDIX family)